MTRLVGLWLALLIFLSGPALEGKVRFGDFTIAAETTWLRTAQEAGISVSDALRIQNAADRTG